MNKTWDDAEKFATLITDTETGIVIKILFYLTATAVKLQFTILVWNNKKDIKLFYD